MDFEVNIVNSDRHYQQIADEIVRREIDLPLWARSLAEGDGDEARARAIYIRLRVAQLEALGRAAMVDKAKRSVQTSVEATTRATTRGLRLLFHGVALLLASAGVLASVALVVAMSVWNDGGEAAGGVVVGLMLAGISALVFIAVWRAGRPNVRKPQGGSQPDADSNRESSTSNRISFPPKP